MGLEIDRHEFAPEDRERFRARLVRCLQALEELIARPGFGAGPASIGVEVEMALVDAEGRTLAANRAVQRETDNPRVALEVGRFTLEYASRPIGLAGRPFSALEREIGEALGELSAAAAARGGRLALVGILPTLTEADLHGGLTDVPRYRALSAELRHARGRPFRVQIRRAESIDFTWDDVVLEGASSSLQVHLKVPPAAFARTYNAALIAGAPVLAASGNSPVLLGRLLWDETRIPLFEQAVDDRPAAAAWRPCRAGFGEGWVRQGPQELFAESVRLHAPLLPVVDDDAEDPVEVVRAGRVPALTELRLHQGTVWSWVRAVYDPAGGGGVRMELRPLPSGPTPADMLANTAFLLGLTLGLAPDADALTTALPFRHARASFLAAARDGLDAELAWPAREAPSPQRIPARVLLPRLFAVARRGLEDAGVDAAEAARLIAVVEARVARGVTGARWQRAAIAPGDRPEALREMLARYMELSDAGAPVSEWPPARTGASAARASGSLMRP